MGHARAHTRAGSRREGKEGRKEGQWQEHIHGQQRRQNEQTSHRP